MRHLDRSSSEGLGLANGRREGRDLDGFRAGLAALPRDTDVFVKVDADVDFDPRFFEELTTRFAADPLLGGASGTCYESEHGRWVRRSKNGTTVWGATRAYRSVCLPDVMALEPRMGWDGLDELRVGCGACAPRPPWTYPSAITGPRAGASSPLCITARPWNGRRGTWATGPATSPCERSGGPVPSRRAGHGLRVRLGSRQARAALPGLPPWSGRCATASGCARPSAAARRPPSAPGSSPGACGLAPRAARWPPGRWRPPPSAPPRDPSGPLRPTPAHGSGTGPPARPGRRASPAVPAFHRPLAVAGALPSRWPRRKTSKASLARADVHTGPGPTMGTSAGASTRRSTPVRPGAAAVARREMAATAGWWAPWGSWPGKPPGPPAEAAAEPGGCSRSPAQAAGGAVAHQVPGHGGHHMHAIALFGRVPRRAVRSRGVLDPQILAVHLEQHPADA